MRERTGKLVLIKQTLITTGYLCYRTKIVHFLKRMLTRDWVCKHFPYTFSYYIDSIEYFAAFRDTSQVFVYYSRCYSYRVFDDYLVFNLTMLNKDINLYKTELEKDLHTLTNKA